MATVASILREHRDEILEIWRAEAVRSASGRGLDAPELLNIIPTYLDALATPEAKIGTFDRERRKLVENHLSSRLRQGFDLPEILAEFSMLGRAIANVCDLVAPGECPTAKDLAAYHDELTSASTAVAEMFREHLLADEQSQRRYERLIQKIASASLEVDAVPFRERLKEVVTLLMEAVGAQSVALLLLDAKTETLITAASAGAGDEELERYTTSLDPSSFPGHIAEHEEPTEILDAFTTKLDVSDGLRKSGIRSLLGIRLPSHHRLVGVLYFGLAEARAFLPHEIHRIQSMGDRLTIHLDNARLHAELRAQVLELEGEKDLRERFVNVLAHDLRGPLSAIRFGAEAIVGRPEALEERRELAIRIARNVERADRMIRDLLDANRIRAGETIPLKLEECDLGAVANEVVEEAASLHGDRFQLNAEPLVRGVWSADELRRSIWNLVTNAVKYGTRHSLVTIHVRRTPNGARVSVHNIGPIIPKDERAGLFEAYSRTRAARIGAAKGWGLGLTLVRGATEAHGGHVFVESDETGTTFTIDLPADSRPFQPRTAPAVSDDERH